MKCKKSNFYCIANPPCLLYNVIYILERGKKPYEYEDGKGSCVFYK